MEIKLSRHNREKRMVTLRMDEEAFRKMYDTLIYTRANRRDPSSLDEYAEGFYAIWNKVCDKFEIARE